MPHDIGDHLNSSRFTPTNFIVINPNYAKKILSTATTCAKANFTTLSRLKVVVRVGVFMEHPLFVLSNFKIN